MDLVFPAHPSRPLHPTTLPRTFTPSMWWVHAWEVPARLPIFSPAYPRLTDWLPVPAWQSCKNKSPYLFVHIWCGRIDLCLVFGILCRVCAVRVVHVCGSWALWHVHPPARWHDEKNKGLSLLLATIQNCTGTGRLYRTTPSLVAYICVHLGGTVV
jgi:hypothetical protein